MIEKIIGATVATTLGTLADGSFDNPQIGYLVKPYTKRIETGEGQFKDLVIPVALNVTNADCEVGDYGLNVLTPQKGYRPMIHISAVGDLVSETAENIPKRRGLNIEQDIAIDVWMDDHQGTAHLAKAAIIKALYNITYKRIHIDWFQGDVADPEYFIYVNKLKCRFVRETAENPFAEYDFAKDQALFANNYAAFGLVFKLTGLVFPDCVPDYPRLTHDECS
jgi:hypothetical protein